MYIHIYRFIMAELLHTERTYVKDLETSVKVSTPSVIQDTNEFILCLP